jgi:hypothetical protein
MVKTMITQLSSVFRMRLEQSLDVIVGDFLKLFVLLRSAKAGQRSY